VEQYQIDLAAAAEDSRKRMSNILRNLCSAQVPGDTQRGLRISPQFDHATFKHVLLPVWMAAYRYRGRAFRFVVNGRTGAVEGERPYSKVKIALLVLAMLLAAITIAALQITQR